MSRRLVRSSLIGVAFAAIVLTWSSLGAAQNTSARKRDAFNRGGFAAAAAITGSVERTIDVGGDVGPSTADQLVRGSQVVFVGRLRSSRAMIVPRGDTIRTHYLFDVLSVLKGQETMPGLRDAVTVSVLGGRAALPNGQWAQLNVRYSEPLKGGQVYLLFVNAVPSDALVGSKAPEAPEADYWPLHGPSGIFGLGTGGVQARPADRRHLDRDVVKSFPDPNALVREIEKAVQRVGS